MMTSLKSMPWSDLVAVGIRTTADGPFCDDLFWQFLLRDRVLEIPGQAIDGEALREIQARLPEIDSGKIILAMGSTDDRIFRLWHRDESHARPHTEALAARFVALVHRMGGDRESARPTFERVNTAWTEVRRRYHGIEHLLDCLREIDVADVAAPDRDLAELALWYHDVVYEPFARDCEARSAAILLEDGAALGIPRASLKIAAELVRTTAHASGWTGAGTPVRDLVLDIDLSILGRDVLRFMEYEYAIEEEYAPTCTATFRIGRGRFLASLLERPSIFRTDRFRRRHEEPARRQIGALLESPRYLAYRAVRWLPGV
jgi:predicted metal-dependent HD superfamily phosphohydrolase